MKKRLDPRVAIITGASSGIGAELARQLAKTGVKVGLTARREVMLEALATEIRSAGGVVSVVTADASDPRATRAVIEKLEGELGPVDLLIANAGIGGRTPAVGFSAEAFETILRVNLLAPAAAIEAVLPGMIARGRGHLVGISSLASFRGLPVSAGYSASKAGLSTLLQGLRVELSPRGVDVTVVHPGFVRTPMIEGNGRPQPFLMEVGPAARIILRGIARRSREVNFPWPTVAMIRLARALPGDLGDRMLRRTLRPEDQ